jgi:hypothetical protein
MEQTNRCEGFDTVRACGRCSVNIANEYGMERMSALTTARIGRKMLDSVTEEKPIIDLALCEANCKGEAVICCRAKKPYEEYTTFFYNSNTYQRLLANWMIPRWNQMKNGPCEIDDVSGDSHSESRNLLGDGPCDFRWVFTYFHSISDLRSFLKLQKLAKDLVEGLEEEEEEKQVRIERDRKPATSEP